MEDIIRGEWEPRTIGEAMDLLIIRNIRMWHLQERVYHLEALEAQDKEGLVSYLKDATWMNLRRNFDIDGLDRSLVQGLFGEEGLERGRAVAVDTDTRIWEAMDGTGA